MHRVSKRIKQIQPIRVQIISHFLPLSDFKEVYMTLMFMQKGFLKYFRNQQNNLNGRILERKKIEFLKRLLNGFPLVKLFIRDKTQDFNQRMDWFVHHLNKIGGHAMTNLMKSKTNILKKRRIVTTEKNPKE